MSFLRKLELKRNVSLYYVSRSSGLKFYAYLLVPANLSNKFEHAISAGSYNLGEYGTVIEFRIGASESPEHLKEEVVKFIEDF